jgi:hypothetical protein
MHSTEIITFRSGTVGRAGICENINLNLTAAFKESTLIAKSNGTISKFVVNNLFE